MAFYRFIQGHMFCFIDLFRELIDMSWFQGQVRNPKLGWFCDAGAPSPTKAVKGLSLANKGRGGVKSAPSVLELTS